MSTQHYREFLNQACDEAVWEDFIRRVYPVYTQVEGWLPNAQAMALFACARAVPENGVIVEIGSFLGKSAIVLGMGSHESVKVYSIDPFNGAGSAVYDSYKGRNLYNEWMENIIGAGVDHKVTPLTGFSQDVVKGWAYNIDLLYIDGDHHYEPVCQDIVDWTPFLKPGGTLAMDDAWEEGVGRAIDLCIKASTAPQRWANWITIEGRLFVAIKGA